MNGYRSGLWCRQGIGTAIGLAVVLPLDVQLRQALLTVERIGGEGSRR